MLSYSVNGLLSEITQDGTRELQEVWLYIMHLIVVLIRKRKVH